MSEQTINTLYGALARLDGKAMAQCYAEDARFDDEVFSLNGRRSPQALPRAHSRLAGRAVGPRVHQ